MTTTAAQNIAGHGALGLSDFDCTIAHREFLLTIFPVFHRRVEVLKLPVYGFLQL
jgi:hypothetical protein